MIVDLRKPPLETPGRQEAGHERTSFSDRERVEGAAHDLLAVKEHLYSKNPNASTDELNDMVDKVVADSIDGALTSTNGDKEAIRQAAVTGAVEIAANARLPLESVDETARALRGIEQRHPDVFAASMEGIRDAYGDTALSEVTGAYEGALVLQGKSQDVVVVVVVVVVAGSAINHGQPGWEQLDMRGEGNKTLPHGVEVADGYDRSSANRRWNMLTEAARRAVATEPGLADELKPFATMPLSEGVPRKLVDATERQNEQTGSIVNGNLQARLDLPEVSIGEAVNIRAASEQRDGITEAEYNLVADRYKYARDAKLLGFMAEMQAFPLADIREEGAAQTFILQSGVEVTIDKDVFRPELFAPETWGHRRQLKDRVYATTVGGEQFIMKERKTAYHTDTRPYAEGEGPANLTAREEFAVAQVFSRSGNVEQGDVKLHWETPVGCVEFPDGYQFTLFEREEQLDDNEDRALRHLAESIASSPEAYRKDFERISERSQELRQLSHMPYRRTDEPSVPRALNSWDSAERIAEYSELMTRYEAAMVRWKEKYRALDNTGANVTFEEFAHMKAYQLIEEGKALYASTIKRLGYENTDHDGFGFAMNRSVDGRVALEIIGFDYEYFHERGHAWSGQVVPEPQKWTQDIKDASWRVIRDEVGDKYSYSPVLKMAEDLRLSTRWFAPGETNPAHEEAVVAAAYALLEESGFAIPGKDGKPLSVEERT